MKADYKNWMPKGMVASFIGGTAGALAIVPAARLLMPQLQCAHLAALLSGLI